MMYCHVCHRDSPNDFKKCPNCGHPSKKAKIISTLKSLARRVIVFIFIALYATGAALGIRVTVEGFTTRVEIGIIIIATLLSINILLRKKGIRMGSLCG